MNNKFSAIIPGENTLAYLDRSKTTVTEVERQVATPIIGRLEVNRPIGVVVCHMGRMSHRFEEVTFLY